MYRFGTFEIDFERAEIRLDDTPQHVEPQVFALICHLIDHRDRVISKDELIDVIWNGRAISDSALTSRINAARRVLGDNGRDQVVIKTFAKRGFRFVAPISIDVDGEAAKTHQTPRILVLPFRLSSSTAAGEYEFFAEGLIAETIAALGRFPEFEVIAASTALRLGPQNAAAPNIATKFGADYIVEGSIRVSHNRIRVSVELALSDRQSILMAHSIERETIDLPELQIEIAQHIAGAIEPGIELSESRRAEQHIPGDMTASAHFYRGISELYQFRKNAFDTAEHHFQVCLEIQPSFEPAYAYLGYVFLQRYWYGPHDEREKMKATARNLARRAIALDAHDSMAHFVLGRVLALDKEHDRALAELWRAIELNRSFAQAHFGYGQALFYADRSDEALPYLEKAISLSPADLHLWTFHHVKALALFDLGRMAEARHAAIQSIASGHATHWAYATLLAILGTMGSLQEARGIRSELLEIQPSYSLDFARRDFEGFMRGRFAEKYVEGLALASLPECDSSR